MPVLTVIAGPNGSGKSTLIARLREHGIDFGIYFNADDIARDLTGLAVDIARQAQEIVRAGRAASMEQRLSHSFETVMSHMSHVEYMREAGTKGFEVRLYFVATDKPEVNLQRVANRVIHGGHDVPAERIISRYYRCLENLPEAVRASDSALVFDNSQADQPLRLLAEIAARRLIHHRFLRNPATIPAWWLSILPKIKPVDPFENGPFP